jgi:iron(III) transport system permease protein
MRSAVSLLNLQWWLLPGFLLIPLLVVYASWGQFQPELWSHLADTVLPDYLLNSLLLAVGAGVLALLLGGSLGFLLHFYRFPGRDLFNLLLILPLALPAYIIAYSYTALLDFSGPVQAAIREASGFGYGEYWFPQIRSVGGAIWLFALVLYPYVFLLTRASLAGQSPRWREVCQSLGVSRRRYVWSVLFPLTRPALFGGMALVMMEVFADYGTVQYFGIPTLTTGIFRTWFGMNDRSGAAQLASLLCTLALALMLLELYSRRQLRFYHAGQSGGQLAPVPLRGPAAWLATVAVSLVVWFAFLWPSLALLRWSIATPEAWLSLDYLQLLGNSISLAGGSVVVVVSVAMVLVYGLRQGLAGWQKLLIRLSGLGYAVPGTVIAIGVMWPLSAVDNWLDHFMEQQFGIRTGLLLSGTVAALLLAYLIRFLAVAMQSLESGMSQIKPSMDQAAASLGCSRWQVMRRLHFPVLKTSLWTAALLVFVDVLKELPATLLLRPFNFDTLAVRTFELASDEQLAAAAVPALTIVLAGLLPVILLNKAALKNR